MTSPTKPRAREGETGKNSATRGEQIAALWRKTYGDAWVSSADVIGEGGICEGSATWQQVTRSLQRAGVLLERQTVAGTKGYLYKLP